MIFGNFTPDYLRVNLIWDNLHIDNSTLGGSAGQDSAVFQIKSGDGNGGVYITGGTILVDTTQTGIKYNGGGGGMGGGSGSSDAATSDGQYIIGAPGGNSRP